MYRIMKMKKGKYELSGRKSLGNGINELTALDVYIKK